MERSIKINWHFNEQNSTNINWINWSAEVVAPVAQYVLLEKALFFPSGTISILDHAFKLGLNRFDGWDLRGLEGEISAYITAAKIYKRGVPFKSDNMDYAVRSQHGAYSIEILEQEDVIVSLLTQADIFVIVDKNVYENWRHVFAKCKPLVLEVNEQTKNLMTVGKIISFWANCSRVKRWVIIGGGVLSDIAAFAATLCQSDFTMVPTTLLAMADACVGGKAGVNHIPYGKNQVGCFTFPLQVITWSGWLKTLSKRQLRAGAAECFKHALISGDKNLVTSISSALKEDNNMAWEKLLTDIIKVKAEIVAIDPMENSVRAGLNLGHTLAHALEAISHNGAVLRDYMLHGEAVSLGILYSCILSEKITNLSSDDLTFVHRTLRNSGCLLPKEQIARFLGFATLDDPHLWNSLRDLFFKDKKAERGVNNASRWVLLTAVGSLAHTKEGKYSLPVDDDSLQAGWQKFIFSLD